MPEDRPKLLLLDDEENVRMSLAMLLDDEGYDVVEAASVPDARAALQQTSFDVVILDRRVGPDKGTDLIPEIRQIAPAAAIIVLSGSTNADGAPGADVVIDKIDSPKEVLDRLEAFLKGRGGRG